MIIPFLNKATLFMVSPLISKTSKKNISQINNSDQRFFLLLYNCRITCTLSPVIMVRIFPWQVCLYLLIKENFWIEEHKKKLSCFYKTQIRSQNNNWSTDHVQPERWLDQPKTSLTSHVDHSSHVETVTNLFISLEYPNILGHPWHHEAKFSLKMAVGFQKPWVKWNSPVMCFIWAPSGTFSLKTLRGSF